MASPGTVVGGGTSALQFIQQLSASGAEPVWTTRRPPQWTARTFDTEWGLDVERSVSERTRQGLPPLSVSAATGIPLNDLYTPDIASGLLVSRGRLAGLTEHGAVIDGPGPDGSGSPTQGEADSLIDPVRVATLPGHRADRMPNGEDAGTDALWETPIDTVLWATGFRAHVPHLRGLGIRERAGGIRMADDGVTVVRMPGLFLAGYGASASTLGATRAGRRAAMAALGRKARRAKDAAA